MDHLLTEMLIPVAAAAEATVRTGSGTVYTRRIAIKNDRSSHLLVIRPVYQSVHLGWEHLKQG